MTSSNTRGNEVTQYMTQPFCHISTEEIEKGSEKRTIQMTKNELVKKYVGKQVNIYYQHGSHRWWKIIGVQGDGILIAERPVSHSTMPVHYKQVRIIKKKTESKLSLNWKEETSFRIPIQPNQVASIVHEGDSLVVTTAPKHNQTEEKK